MGKILSKGNPECVIGALLLHKEENSSFYLMAHPSLDTKFSMTVAAWLWFTDAIPSNFATNILSYRYSDRSGKRTDGVKKSTVNFSTKSESIESILNLQPQLLMIELHDVDTEFTWSR